MTTAYNPANQFEIKAWDVEFRRDPVRTLMAHIYEPQAEGPFPALLDLHGGAWNNQNRMANTAMDERLASSGILVVAIDMRLAPEAPYPASVADANYGVRWLKAKAREWNGDPATVGALGSSSGGHVIELCAMRPHDPRYNAHPLSGVSGVDATLAYVAARSPVSDPFARYQQAEKMGREKMLQNSKIYFNPWKTILEGNPQLILERGEAVTLPPLLVLQGELDDNVLLEVQEKFAKSYRAAGGECNLELFQGCEHQWVRTPGPQTDRAIEKIKSFVARQLKALQRAA
ncbi:MAG: alpha/beta hydrolase [Candidatus Binatia bacterium]